VNRRWRRGRYYPTGTFVLKQRLCDYSRDERSNRYGSRRQLLSGRTVLTDAGTDGGLAFLQAH